MLYGAALAKAIQLMEHVCPSGVWREAMGLLLVVTAAWGYAKWLKRQDDIPYNKVFHLLGWGVMAIILLMQAALLAMTCIKLIES